MPKFKVLRRLDGDKLYEAGDVRELSEADAKHLVALGSLEPVAEKAEAAPKNKMEAAPANKAEPASETKADEPSVTATAEPVADEPAPAPKKTGRKAKK